MFTIITASRFEDLEQRLLARVMQPGDNPFDDEPVLVASSALRRHLSLAVADRYGVCAQIRFSFPFQWLWQQIAAMVPGIPDHSPFDPDTLRWRILDRLADPMLRRAHPRLGAYLADADAVMLFDLATRIAGLFDQYLTYRPDWLEAWSACQLCASLGDEGVARADEGWQAELWRRVLAGISTTRGPAVGGGTREDEEHPARAFLQRLDAAAAAAVLPPRLPARVHVFCVPTMPPLYIDLLRGLASHIDVDLYVLNPCREYWLDLVDRREHARRAVAGDEAYHEVGHRLLSAWGRQTQAYLHLLLAQDGEVELEDAETRRARGHGLLAAVQDGIHALQDLVPGGLCGIAAPDGSLEVHVCHSLTRELEVLHDCLLARLAASDTLHPSEILVVVPDLDAAAPLIEGVFGNPPRGCRIPYAVTGVAPVMASSVAQALLAALQAARSRLPLSGVLELLHRPLVGTRFGLAGEALEQLAGLLRAADVHWGYDAAHRAALGLPLAARASLSEGRERLFLGYALPDEHPSAWQGQLAAGASEGSASLLLGAFDEFLNQLGALRRRLERPLDADSWQVLLEDVLAAFVADPPELREERLALLENLQEQGRQLRAGSVAQAIPVDILLRALLTCFETQASGGVPTGAVTFSNLASLRNLPYRVICVLGLNDPGFPSTPRRLEFDLMAGRPRAGDRQRGEDDRNVFLDLILAARQCLHLSYSGFSVRDNQPRPASVVLAELIAALEGALCPVEASAAERAAMRGRLVRNHPLQPFDEAYFSGQSASRRGPPDADAPAPLFSFRSDYADALSVRSAERLREAAGGERAGTVRTSGLADAGGTGDEDDAQSGDNLPVFFDRPLPTPGPEWRAVQPAQLIRFLQNPARALLRERLELQLPDRPEDWQDSEDFLPAFGSDARLAQRLLPPLLAGMPEAEVRALAAVGTEYPAGPLGARARDGELNCLLPFARGLRGWLVLPEQAPRGSLLEFDLGGARWTLDVSVSGLRAGVQLGWSYRNPHVHQELESWVRHLCLCASAQPGEAWRTVWLLRGARLGFDPLTVAVAREHLGELMELYRDGLSRPLHFFPKSARRFVETGSLAKAREVWQSTAFRPYGEDRDPAWKLALRGGAEPLDSEFERSAQRVFAPLLAGLVQEVAP